MSGELMPRWAWGVLAGSIVLLVALVGSYRAADAVCTADPPGVSIPEHQGRALSLGQAGWHCALANDGLTVVDVELGWWPRDPTDVWSHATTR
jgi:hypothetical protein